MGASPGKQIARAEKHNNEAPLLCLLPEILAVIVGFISAADLHAVVRVCRTLHFVCQADLDRRSILCTCPRVDQAGTHQFFCAVEQLDKIRPVAVEQLDEIVPPNKPVRAIISELSCATVRVINRKLGEGTWGHKVLYDGCNKCETLDEAVEFITKFIAEISLSVSIDAIKEEAGWLYRKL